MPRLPRIAIKGAATWWRTCVLCKQDFKTDMPKCGACGTCMIELAYIENQDVTKGGDGFKLKH